MVCAQVLLYFEIYGKATGKWKMSKALLKIIFFTFLFNFAISNFLQQLFLIPVNIFGNLYIVKYLLPKMIRTLNLISS